MLWWLWKSILAWLAVYIPPSVVCCSAITKSCTVLVVWKKMQLLMLAHFHINASLLEDCCIRMRKNFICLLLSCSALFLLISTADRGLFCSSKNLIDSLAHPTTYCQATGEYIADAQISVHSRMWIKNKSTSLINTYYVYHRCRCYLWVLPFHDQYLVAFPCQCCFSSVDVSPPCQKSSQKQQICASALHYHR